MNERELQAQIKRIAAEHPETRKHLIPLLKQGGNGDIHRYAEIDLGMPTVVTFFWETSIPHTFKTLQGEMNALDQVIKEMPRVTTGGKFKLGVGRRSWGFQVRRSLTTLRVPVLIGGDVMGVLNALDAQDFFRKSGFPLKDDLLDRIASKQRLQQRTAAGSISRSLKFRVPTSAFLWSELRGTVTLKDLRDEIVRATAVIKAQSKLEWGGFKPHRRRDLWRFHGVEDALVLVVAVDKWGGGNYTHYTHPSLDPEFVGVLKQFGFSVGGKI